MKRYFITATDTDAGKTYVTCELIKYYKKINKKTLAVKPIVSGCTEYNGEFIYEDQILQTFNEPGLCPITRWKFEVPMSPHMAAAQSNSHICIQEMLNFCTQEKFLHNDIQLIEGAGGLMVPLNEHHTWVDFLKVSNIPVILIVGMRLGCLNHALMTQYVLKKENIPCAGWIANCLDPNMLAIEENIATLRKKIAFPMLGIVKYRDGFEIAENDHK